PGPKPRRRGLSRPLITMVTAVWTRVPLLSTQTQTTIQVHTRAIRLMVSSPPVRQTERNSSARVYCGVRDYRGRPGLFRPGVDPSELLVCLPRLQGKEEERQRPLR